MISDRKSNVYVVRHIGRIGVGRNSRVDDAQCARFFRKACASLRLKNVIPAGSRARGRAPERSVDRRRAPCIARRDRDFDGFLYRRIGFLLLYIMYTPASGVTTFQTASASFRVARL